MRNIVKIINSWLVVGYYIVYFLYKIGFMLKTRNIYGTAFRDNIFMGLL